MKSNRTVRHKRIRAKVKGTAERPRLCVFRSNAGIYAQVINDDENRTILAADSRSAKGPKGAKAEAVGKAVAEKAAGLGIKKAVFDRGGYRYTGNVRKLADAARAGGLEF